MKKFCSKCGNLLNLGKKNCTACQAFNPYFISGFISPEPLGKIEVEDNAPAKAGALQAEQLERERVEQTFKNELQKVKEENEQHQKETLNLVIEVQKELQDIDKENKLLKQTVQSLKNSRETVEVETVTPTPTAAITNEKPRQSYSYVTIAAIVSAVLIAGFSYFALSKNDNKTNSSSANIHPGVPVQTSDIAPGAKSATISDTTHAHKLLAVAAPVANRPLAAPTAPTAMAAPKAVSTSFTLTATRAMGDLVGKKLSGCDITINSPAEISRIDNLVLVEKLSASYLKYKCTVKIKQGNETYTASPYIYYSAEGSFIKVDGTNCE